MIVGRLCPYLTQKQAAAGLLTNDCVVRSPPRPGSITANGPGSATFRESDIEDFGDEYMLSSMAAEALGVRTAPVRDRMTERGSVRRWSWRRAPPWSGTAATLTGRPRRHVPSGDRLLPHGSLHGWRHHPRGGRGHRLRQPKGRFGGRGRPGRGNGM